MIEWKLLAIGYDKEEVIFDLMSLPQECYLIKETDNIQFQVSVDNKTFIEYGAPYVVLGDIPLGLEFNHQTGNNSVFYSSDPLEHHSSRFFYNFFGESEVALTFEGIGSYISTCTVEILARTENAQLANEMLGHITDNLEDAVSICFSRTKIAGSLEINDSFNFTRLDVIENAISYFSENLQFFIREHKHTWKAEMQLSERGQPTGPDSVYWVLSNLDRISPASTEESNLIYNNRSYRLDALPNESMVSECDVYENRVLHTFLHNIIIFLIELKDEFYSSTHAEQIYNNSDYVRFDHTMQRFAHIVLKHKTLHIESLLASVERIRKVLVKNIPSRIVPSIELRMTSYVAKHSHYRQAFNLIEQCNAAPAPKFEGSEMLLGLKNLAIVYEISTLLMLHNSIKRCLHVELFEQSFRHHSDNYPFGGIEKERPYGCINNHFIYRNDMFDIELFYEPKIFPYSPTSSIGDLVDTSDSRSTAQYGKHHYCPDFVVKIMSKRWRKPVTIILDSKYKDSSTVKKYDMAPLTQKYLLNIHQVNDDRGLGVSPIQLLLILFAHNRTGSIVRTVASRHCLNGALPVLPQSSAILLKPSDTVRLDEHLKGIVNVMDKENSL